MWILYAFGSAFFAGLTAILAKIGIKKTDSTLATAIRTIVVLFFTWVMVFIVGSQSQIGEIDPKTLLFLGLSGLATGASWLCYFRALQLGEIQKVTPIDKSSIILTMLMAMILLNEPFTWVKLVAIILISLGTWLMVHNPSKVPQPPSEAEAAAPAAIKPWMLYAFGSAFFAALTAILGKVGIRGVESNLGTALRTVVVLVMAWLMVFVTGKQKGIKAIDKRSWLFIILSGFATGASWLLYYRALKDGQASIVVPIDKLSILVTIAFSYFVFHERLNKRATIGLLAIVVGTLVLLIK
ncbi:MAG TPA: EamA family transporter [Anaerolineaceae bacterium]|nr:EamA family transporter [Anaerolineaceae bacterium]